MRFASLGSGSEGNGLVVEASTSGCRERPWRLMVDCGFGPRLAEKRLMRLGLAPDALDAILVTHEHGDHLGGVFALARRHGIRVYATRGTLRAVMRERFESVDVVACSGREGFAIGTIRVEPFAVPHDAREPVQFVFDDGAHRLGVLTDVGCPTRNVVAALGGCDALVVECNHDLAMLDASDYPDMLKRRIRGDYGHLSNVAAASIVERVDRSRLRHVVAAHLSRTNNLPELARRAMSDATGWLPSRIHVADQHDGFGWIDVESERIFPTSLF